MRIQLDAFGSFRRLWKGRREPKEWKTSKRGGRGCIPTSGPTEVQNYHYLTDRRPRPFLLWTERKVSCHGSDHWDRFHKISISLGRVRFGCCCYTDFFDPTCGTQLLSFAWPTRSTSYPADVLHFTLSFDSRKEVSVYGRCVPYFSPSVFAIKILINVDEYERNQILLEANQMRCVLGSRWRTQQC